MDYCSELSLDNTESSEPPVLDLSCKKQSRSVCNKSISQESCSSPPVGVVKNEITSHFIDNEQKSPFEVRSFMVTPPSESDSPRKIKYEGIYKCSNTPGNISQHNDFSSLPLNVSFPVVSSVLPTLLAQNGGSLNSIQINHNSSTSSVTYPKEITALSTLAADTSKKAPRPFKAYPKDPLSLTVGPPEIMYDQNSNEAYSEFRKRMLESVRRSNEGTNIKMRRSTKSPSLPTSTVDEKDAAYWERRRKNNEAAKRSRDARRAKEDEIAIRAAFLEQENIKLKYELVALRNETAKLRCMIYTS